MWIKNEKGLWVNEKRHIPSTEKKTNDEITITIKGTSKAIKEFLKELHV